MSFGYTDATPPVSVIEAMRTNSDVLFVLAALNGIGPEDNSRDWLCLAQLPNALCVTASTKAGDLFGAYGTNVHIAAPGRRVVVDDDSFPFPPPAQNLSPESLYASPRGFWSVTGTSFATGIMSGICALISERYPNETPEQVIERICQSANPIPGQYQTKCGAVDAYKALTYERTPRLAISRQSLTVAGPKDSISQVSVSTNLTAWSHYMTVTNSGWAQSFSLPSYSAAFFRL
jgi:subtilisin family serine protease